MGTRMERRRGKSCTEKLKGKEGKRWETFMHRCEPYSLLNTSRELIFIGFWILTYIWGFLDGISIQGKRSISDHMNEAVNYINHLQKNINELEIKKEKLKKLPSSRDPLASTASGSSKNCLPNSVTVSPCYGGVEILVTSEKGFALSTIFRLLVDEGIAAVNYFSTEVNGRLFHTIRSEISDQMYVDLSRLQQKLCGLLNGKLIESPTNLPMPTMG
ncbi:transcription factor bHLH118-like isoform X2 [Actinidia eriantha]|uniref:transcription factor bHLH118-like isoform X2 n=1 Tax=Actinidia eriantha TaxID=165200 RepID=UPI00258CF4C4|nr:transcription factor bHLH118-like isoform X2 [Actinidia eriantha]